MRNGNAIVLCYFHTDESAKKSKTFERLILIFKQLFLKQSMESLKFCKVVKILYNY